MTMIFRVIRSIHKRFEHWIFNAYSTNVHQLGLYRILFASAIIFLIGIPQYSVKIASFPAGVFNPPPFFSFFFSDIPPLWYFQWTDGLICLGFLFVLLGLFTRGAGAITALIIIVNNGFIFSTGKIDHSFLVWFTLLMLSFSGWGGAFSIDSLIQKKAHHRTKNWIISLLSLSIGFSFFTAGMIKFLSGWLGLSDSMLRAFYLRNFYIQQKQDYLAPYFENFTFQPFWELGDWFTIVFEVGFLLVVFIPALFRFYTLLALFFHGFVLLMMNIGFDTFIPMYLLFWIPLIDTARAEKTFEVWAKNKKKLIGIVILLVGIYGVNWWLKDVVSLPLSDVLIFTGLLASLFILLVRPHLIFREASKPNEAKIIMFDGVCNLCNGFVQFVIQRDQHAVFKFKPLQDATSDDTDLQSIILVKDGDNLSKSKAFLEIVRNLHGFWPYLYLTIIIPRPIRDAVYVFVANNRYKWFGKQDTCMIPTKELKDRFL